MAIRPPADLKAFFEAGDQPTQQQFWDLIDSLRPRSEVISVNDVSSAYASITLTDADTINWDASTGNIATLVLATGDGNKTLNITGMIANRFHVLMLKRDGAGGIVQVTLPANHYVANGGGGMFFPSTGANVRDMLVGFYDGSETRWTFTKNFS